MRHIFIPLVGKVLPKKLNRSLAFNRILLCALNKKKIRQKVKKVQCSDPTKNICDHVCLGIDLEITIFFSNLNVG